MKERLPAKKVRIKDLLEGKFFYGNSESLEPSYVITKHGIKVSRANVIGTIVDKFVSDDGNYLFFMLEDGTGSIRIKAFKELALKLNKFEIGDLVVAIGKIKEYLGERYLNAEIVRKIENPNYETYRKLELVKEIEERKAIIKEIKEKRESMNETEIEKYLQSIGMDKNTLDVILQLSATEEPDYKDRLLYLISELGGEDGVEIEKLMEIIKLPPEIVESAVSQLLEEGYIYEPLPGKFKMVKK